MNNRPHVVVIGAGIGGLSAALDLSNCDCDVTLLEKDTVVGGKMRETRVGSQKIDSGPTVFTMRWIFEALFADSGHSLEHFVSLTKSNILARHSWLDSTHLDLFEDIDKSWEAIRAFSNSGEADGYRRFALDAAQIFGTLDQPFMQSAKPSSLGLTASLIRSDGLAGLGLLWRTRPFQSLWSNLSRYFSDPRLQQLFGRYATYCGSSPFDAPATLMLISHAERTGVWSVAGGMKRLAEAMQTACLKNNVSIQLNARVQQINHSDTGVHSISVADNNDIECDAIIYNGDAASLSEGLLGESLRGAVPDRRAESRSLSAITVSAIGKSSGFDLSHHSVFFGDNYRDEFAAIFDRDSVTQNPTVYVCAQDRAEPNGLRTAEERLFFLINAPAKTMTDNEIQYATDNLFSLLGRHGLQLELLNSNSASPDDYARRFPGSNGAIYGWPTHGMMGSFKRGGASTKLRGLFMAGGTVHPGPGIPMAAISGRLAASAVRQFCDISKPA